MNKIISNKEKFFKLKHPNYKGEIQKPYTAFLKYMREQKMSKTDFCKLCSYMTGYYENTINNNWFKAKGSYCLLIQDFDLFKKNFQSVVRKQQIKEILDNKTSKTKTVIEGLFDNLKSEILTRKNELGYISEVEHNGRLYNGFGKTKEKSIIVTKKNMIYCLMPYTDLINKENAEVKEFINEICCF